MAGDDVLWILSQNQNADLFLSRGSMLVFQQRVL